MMAARVCTSCGHWNGPRDVLCAACNSTLNIDPDPLNEVYDGIRREQHLMQQTRMDTIAEAIAAVDGQRISNPSMTETWWNDALTHAVFALQTLLIPATHDPLTELAAEVSIAEEAAERLTANKASSPTLPNPEGETR